MRIINGKKLANKILKNLKREIKAKKSTPGLAVILASKDPVSHLYVRNKEKAAAKLGVVFEKYVFDIDYADNRKLITQIRKLNKRGDINGIIVQLPLPKKLDTNKIIKAINPKKDVDGFHPKNKKLISPVAQAVLQLLEVTKKKLKGKRATLFVKSKIFARPIKKLLENKGLKVQVVLDPSLSELKKEARKADVIVTALGRPGILKSSIIKDGAIVIDVGVVLKKCKETRSPKRYTDTRYPKCTEARFPQETELRHNCSKDTERRYNYSKETEPRYNIMGDFDPHGSKKKKGFYTPVPGGVGPMTVAMLLKNVVSVEAD